MKGERGRKVRVWKGLELERARRNHALHDLSLFLSLLLILGPKQSRMPLGGHQLIGQRC